MREAIVRRPESGRQINLLLVDDHTLFREGLRHVLGRLDGSLAMREAAGARAALELIGREADLDLVLLDLDLPDASPFTVLRRIRELRPALPVVAICSLGDRFEVAQALRLGARACVSKAGSAAELWAVLQAILVGDRPARTPVTTGPKQARELTARQEDVLALLARGLCNKEIAHCLGLAEPTVKVHLARLYRALGVANRAAAQRRAFALGPREAASPRR